MSTKPTNVGQFFSRECEFKIGACSMEQLGECRLPEVAFIGKSNVGKSSLINAILEKKIALTSKTPGRTRQLNFFCLDNKLNIVDMPGYGYAKVSKTEISSWEKLSYLYFATRSNLKRVFLLLDARRNLDKKDLELINMFNAVATSYQIVLTKTDELKNEEVQKCLESIESQTKKFAAQHPKIIITISKKNIGLKFLKESIVEIM